MRQHHNIHASYAEPVQRLFNALGIDTYIRPHRHALDPKVESLFALRGDMALITFNEAGEAQKIVRFGTSAEAEAVGVELTPEIWHTVIALTDDALLLEIKAGPFDPQAAKDFAHWSPQEGAESVPQFLDALRALVAQRAGANAIY